MARDCSSAERALLRGRTYGVHARLTVDGVLLSDVLDYDPLLSATWTADFDANAVTGTVTLDLGLDERSLSPLMSAAPINTGADFGRLIYPGRTFVLETACAAAGVSPSAADWRHVFEGYIDRVNPAGGDDTLVVTCRDTMAFYLDRTLRHPDANGFTNAGGPLETTINAILEEQFGPGVGVLVVGDPAWVLNPYWQQDEPIAEAIRRLALQIGWDLRMRYESGAHRDTLTLTLYEPARTGTANDFEIGPDEYYAVRSLEIDGADIRNQIYVIYPPDRAMVTAEDVDSETQYGPRLMTISEDASSNIDTEAEAQRMADGALADLKDPPAQQEIEMRYFWPVEVNDWIEWAANGVHYDTAQRFSVAGYTHSLTKDAQTTVIRTRGTPAAASSEWRRTPQRRTHTATTPPTGTAREGDIWCQVDDVTLP